MKAIITGATGYIGYNFYKRLVGAGHEATCVVRTNSNLTKLNELGCCNFIELNDNNEIIEYFKAWHPDIVFNLASLFVPQHKSEDIPKLIASNVIFPTMLIDAMNMVGVKNFVNIGSAWQNFDGDEYNPSCLYAATKEAFCDILKYYVEAYQFNAITLKFFDTYGPGDPRPKIMNLLQKIAQNGEQLLMSPGEQMIDFVYIDDIVNAIIAAGELLLKSGKQFKGKEFVVNSKKPIRLRDLVSLIEKETGTKLNIKWGGKPYRPREIMKPWSGGEWLPGWAPKVPLEEGIKKLKWSKQ